MVTTLKKAPHSFPLTDSGNAELIAELFGGRLRFDHRRSRWLIWNDFKWTEDSCGEVYLMAKEAARARCVSAAALSNDTERIAEVNWAIKSESRYCLEAALNLAKRTVPIADSGNDWDSDPFLLGVCNGVVNLRTGLLRSATPEDRMILHSTVFYDPSAQCPRFEQFLREVFCEEEETIRFLQRAIGYSLTGSVTEQCLFLCHGDGGNGKGTLFETIRHVLGAYAHNLPFSAFERDGRSSISNDLATLVSKRFVTASETNENIKFNEGRMKMLTGGDQITARFLYGEFFHFNPAAKFWLAFNHLPRVTDDSYGFWRRVRLIPFKAKFSGDQRDRDLPSTLLAEASGILAWALRGCLKWQEEGLGIPPAVSEATEAYRVESDPLAEFLKESCEARSDGFVESGALLSHYNTWAAENNERSMTGREIAPRLRAHGFADAREIVLGTRVRGRRGLILKNETRTGFSKGEDTRTDGDTRIQ
jgi:putative DNA primase/helicase